MSQVERRLIRGDMELCASPAGSDAKFISGYAAMFMRYSGNLGGFKERIAPGAFKRALIDGDCMALWNHDPNLPLGRVSAGTLTVREDGKGLYFRCALPNTTAGRDAFESVSRGDTKGASFGFSMPPDGSGETWDEADDDPEDRGVRFVRRTLKSVATLGDVSPTPFPAYPSTAIEPRSLVEIPSNAPFEFRSRILRSRFNASLTDEERCLALAKAAEERVVREQRRKLFTLVMG